MPQREFTHRARLRRWALTVRRDVFALALAARHPEVPWAARLLAVVAVAYTLSPVDLIPDFVPVLGYLDNLILVPVLIWLAVRLIPSETLAALRAQSDAKLGSAGKGRYVASAVIMIGWMALAAALGWGLYRRVTG